MLECIDYLLLGFVIGFFVGWFANNNFEEEKINKKKDGEMQDM